MSLNSCGSSLTCGKRALQGDGTCFSPCVGCSVPFLWSWCSRWGWQWRRWPMEAVIPCEMSWLSSISSHTIQSHQNLQGCDFGCHWQVLVAPGVSTNSGKDKKPSQRGLAQLPVFPTPGAAVRMSTWLRPLLDLGFVSLIIISVSLRMTLS